jgi:branched-chain amino acid transport system permease protein
MAAAIFVVSASLLAALLSGKLGWDGDLTWLTFLTEGLALAVVAISLVPLVGYGGQISLCQMTFAGIGAVTMAHWGIGPPVLGLVVATLVAAAVGTLVALPALRLRGIYLALATMAFAVFMDRAVFSQARVFETGTLQVPRPFGSVLEGDLAYAGFLALMVAACAVVVVLLRRGPVGRRLQAMRDSEAACTTLGINLTRTKLAVFALSAGMAGFGGALLGGQRGAITATQFEMFQSLPLLLMVVAGGVALISGAIAGAIALASFPFWIDIAPEWDIAGVSGVDFVRYCTLLAPGLVGITLARNPNGWMSGAIRRVAARRGAGARSAERPPVLVAEPGEELETLGVDRPFAVDDIEVVDAVLDIHELLDELPRPEEVGVAGR